MAEEPILTVEDLSFRYRIRPEKAIEGIEFTMGRGELVLIAGASGCGKTTLARCINGLIPRSYRGEMHGSVKLLGREVKSLTPVEVSQTVGTLLQDPERQIVASSVVSEIAFGPENLGLPREEIVRRIDEVMARLKIEHLRDRETFELSGGEKQKIALAGVLAMHPSLLMLDEPLASLDPASAYEAMHVFRELADQGTAVIIIEHRVEDALELHPDRLMYMEAGKVKYLGPVDKLPPEVNYQEVKLPASWVIEQVKEGREPAQPHTPPPPADPAADPLVLFEDVSFAYEDGPLVLHDINLTIRRGDLIAVLGPNGAGKSTLVKHTVGLLKPTKGRVLLEGKDTRQISVAQAAHTVGYVFQSPSQMLFAPTVREELAFGPKNLGFPKDKIVQNIEMSVAALNLVGLEEYPPLGLSFGQQKRTSIASILAMRSKIMIMDEPTAGQDYANYSRFMDAMTRASDKAGKSLLAANFAATLFITHDLDLAVTYANRVLLVGNGRIVVDGAPEDALGSDELLLKYRVRPTSLLRLNRELLPRTGHFLPAESLAQYV